ncbi:MAG: DUF4292 domain-containing protein [Bacteroidales bacterium]|nr:DUF4292 domain-containing protein [Bacteroidales bacterium]
MKIIIIVLMTIIMGSLFFSSCDTTKKVEKKNIKIRAVDSVFLAMKEHEFSYDWFQGKFNANYKSGDKKQNFSGQFRIRKDSVIWISIVAVMNIEVFRVIIKQDSVFMLNRLKKTYYSRNIGFLNEQLGTDLDFDILQSLLIGSDFDYYENDKFTLSASSDQYKLSTVSRRKLKKYISSQDDMEKVLVQNLWVSQSDFKIQQQSVRQVKNPNKKVVVQYLDFREVNSQEFPYHMIFRLVGEKIIKLDLEYKSIIINKPLTFPFRISKKYSRL